MKNSAIALAAALAVMTAPACAQQYPAKSIRFILPFPPGGPTDLLGRIVAQKLADQLGQPVVPDNRPGAGGNLGLELAAKSPPDGYTVVLSSPLVAISPSLYPKLGYDPAKDLAPISLVAGIQNIMVVHPSVPAKTLKEFVQLAKNNPGELNFGSGGVGTTTHLAPELLMSVAHINMVHVPYKGTGQALIGLISGQVDMVIMAAAAAAPQIQAGKVRPIAVFSARRTPVAHDVPTTKEAGIPGIEVELWYGILTSAGTPRDIVERLNAEIVRALAAPEVREKLAASGIEPLTDTPDEFAKFIRSETVRFARVIKDAGIKPE